MATNPTGVYTYVLKYLTMSQMCTLTMFTMAFRCGPGGQPPVIGAMGTTSIVSASAFTVATNPSCGWNCTGCGQVTIDGPNDGLPVELMDFAVKDGDASDGADQSGEDSEGREDH